MGSNSFRKKCSIPHAQGSGRKTKPSLKRKLICLKLDVGGQVLSATKSQNEIDSKIQTFIQQSTNARESVAVCEKIENAEAEGKDQIPRLQEQLAAVEKRRSDLTRDYDSLMAELEPLHAKLKSLKDSNLEEQKARVEESEQAAIRAWEESSGRFV
ncbi:unnamed protein product [Cuscuta campestris]|uniref:Uncharacterized protein n=1 Tax=Cuscuta campestris TaxID=132261 RepID=A0A484MZH1_9ASTE|nr:unnamed protein product [Cuscuta campestris]